MAFTNYLEDENDKPYFTTNSLAYYYDKMEGFAKAVEGSAKALNLTKEEVEKRITLYIEQNKNELDQRLAQWDGKLETFDGSVEKLLAEWVDDGTLTHVIDSTLIDQKIAPVALQLEETVKAEDNNLFFNPERVTNGFTNTQMGSLKTQDVYNLYDGLVDGKYITKTNPDKDQSGLFDLFTYEFTPKNYTKTLIISANIHGPGTGGDPRDVTVGLYYFLKQLVERQRKDRHLNKIRNKVRLIVIPVLNPWGYDNASRYNSRGVDLCRNFPYGWDTYIDTTGTRPKGTSAVSEKESQYLKSILDANPNADAYIDYHAWMNTDLTFGYEYADDANTETSKLAFNLADNLIRKYNLSRPQMSMQVLTNEPTPGRYAYHMLGIASGNPEFYVYVNDLPNREEEIWTRMVEWYGNFIYLYAMENVKPKTSGNVAYISSLQATASEVVNNANTILKAFENKAERRPFPFDPTTGEITIPEGVTVIKIQAQVYFNFNSPTEERMQLALFIQKNSGRTVTYPVNKQVVTLGGTSLNMRDHVIQVNSGILGVLPGDKFRLNAFTTHTGGNVRTGVSGADNQFEATWINVEEYVRPVKA